MFEVKDRILIFDGQCIITAFDVLKKIDNTFKPSKISLYDEHVYQLKPTDIVKKGRVYTFRNWNKYRTRLRDEQEKKYYMLHRWHELQLNILPLDIRPRYYSL